MCFDTLQSFFHLNLHTLVSSLGAPQAGLAKNWVNTELIIWLLSYSWLAELLVLPLSQCHSHSQSPLCYIFEFHVGKRAKLWTKAKVKKGKNFFIIQRRGLPGRKEKAEVQKKQRTGGDEWVKEETHTVKLIQKPCLKRWRAALIGFLMPA